MVPFGREYVLVSIPLGAGVNCRINEAVAANDHERAAASIACMTSDSTHLHILIERWREDGDSEQDPAGSVDAAATVGKPRRTRSSTTHDAGTAAGDLAPSLDYGLE